MDVCIRVYDEELERESELRVLYHDAHYLVVDKPADMNIDPGKTCELDLSNIDGSTRTEYKRPSVYSVLRNRFPRHELKNVHQIDYGTSGIFCFALSRAAASDASGLFQRRHVEKEYLALVRGHVERDEQIISEPIGDDPNTPLKQALNGFRPRSAESYCKVLKRGYFGLIPCTLVKLHPKTGRRHQLRLHMLAIGHPIIGDLSYEQPITPAFRMMLHACKIAFRFDLIKRHKRRFVRGDMPFVIWLYKALGSILHNLKSQPVRYEPLVVESENPFESLITDEPIDVFYEEERAAVRMDRHEWVQRNLKWEDQPVR